MGPRGAKVSQVGVKRGSKEVKMSPRWFQRGPKRTPRMTTEGPEVAQAPPKGSKRDQCGGSRGE